MARARKTASPPADDTQEMPPVGGPITDDGGRPQTDDGGRVLNLDTPAPADVEAAAEEATS